MRVTPSIYSYNLILRAARDCGSKDLNGKHRPIESVLLLEEKTYSRTNNPLDPAILTTSELATVTNQLTVHPNLLAEKIHSNNVMALKDLERPENRYIYFRSVFFFFNIINFLPSFFFFVSFLRLALLGGIEGFLAEMSKDYVKPDIKTFSLLLETIASNPSEEKVRFRLDINEIALITS